MYKDKNEQRAYQREWMRRRRLAWLTDNGPCATCGSWDQLEIDHIDYRTKKYTPAHIYGVEEKASETRS